MPRGVPSLGHRPHAVPRAAERAASAQGGPGGGGARLAGAPGELRLSPAGRTAMDGSGGVPSSRRLHRTPTPPADGGCGGVPSTHPSPHTHPAAPGTDGSKEVFCSRVFCSIWHADCGAVRLRCGKCAGKICCEARLPRLPSSPRRCNMNTNCIIIKHNYNLLKPET
jgi:hypothetical protein